MRRVSAVVLVTLAGCGPLEVGEQVGAISSPIVAGELSYGDPEVFYLSIRYPSGGFQCSGTLIAPHTILTAAHCVEPFEGTLPTSWRVRNSTSAFTSPAWSVVDGVQSLYHPQWSGEPGTPFDIAFIQLAREPFAPTKAYATEPATSIPFFSTMRAVGYGITQSGAGDNGLKRAATVKLSRADDKFIYLPEGVTSTCQGDSGGPTFFSYGGVEKVTGITSYGPAGSCNSGGQTRVDIFQGFIAQTVGTFEVTTCTDAAKLGGCLGLECRLQDAACSCGEDGTCNDTCPARTPDPDCLASCAQDQVCSRAACPTPDPDCQAIGLPCGREGHCAGRTCITSPQHPQAYCSRPCAGASDCPMGFTCTSGVCQHVVLPEAAFEEPCTPGATYCKDSVQQVCAATVNDDTTRCREQCFENANCRDGYTCSVKFEDRVPGVCQKNISFKRLGTQALEPWSCAAVNATSPWAVVAMLLLAARRRKPST